jgi:oligopeptide transport system substrate-binding protein
MLTRCTIRALSIVLLLATAACGESNKGPIEISLIGGPPTLSNPNLKPLDPPSAFLVGAVAQGLVRFDAQGQIEPALAERWIVSDDGLRYIFRLKRATWPSGAPITAEYVASRLRAALGRSSRNPLKPVLGAIDEVTAMTDDVIEIALKSPRANFLQLLAQPEMAVLRGKEGSGPYRIAGAEDALVTLEPLRDPDVEDSEESLPPPLRLRGERASLAIARFVEGDVALVMGGTAGNLPLARTAGLPGARLVFDPAAGLFGLTFATNEGALADADVRAALAMALDRGAIVSALGVSGLQPRDTMSAPGVHELPQPARPDWTPLPLAERQARARGIIAEAEGEKPLRLRVAMPEGLGYDLIFAHLRRDWRAIGVEAEKVGSSAPAELRFIDQVAPVNLASWYLRSFSCAASRICSAEADALMEQVRTASPADRRRLIAEADARLQAVIPFIAIASPVRWSLVSPRLTGFRPNPLARHAAGELVATSP